MSGKTKGNDTTKKTERKRFLNVIYFVDSHRTHTLKFSIGQSYFTVGFLAFCVIWSIVATGLLLRDRVVIAEMNHNTRGLLGQIFQYQTRHDEVYEKAYPAPLPSTSAPAEAVAAASAASKTPEKMLSADLTPATPKQNNVSQAKAQEIPLEVSNFTSQIDGLRLVVRLSIKNLDSPNRTSGSVTAEARFVDQNQQEHTLTAQVNGQGEDNDEHFNIRYFKNKSFLFQPPAGSTGRFMKVLVTVNDDAKRSRVFEYPLNKEVSEPNRPTLSLSAKAKLQLQAGKKEEVEEEEDSASDETANDKATPDVSDKAPAQTAPAPAHAPAPKAEAPSESVPASAGAAAMPAETAPEAVSAP